MEDCSQINNIRIVKFIAEVIDPDNEHWKGYLMERMVIGSLNDRMLLLRLCFYFYLLVIIKNEFELLSSRGFLTEMCREIAEAIQFLHLARIIHGDINPNK